MAQLTRLKGSTLIETLVAMVIIIICFGIGLLIYVNVLASDNRYQKFHAFNLLKNLSLSIQQENNFLDGDFEVDNIILKKRVVKYPMATGLVQLSLSAYGKNGKLLAQQREILFDQK